MHHDSRYFSDPDVFYPDRWTKEAKLQLPRFNYFPFGGGIRGCVGEPFAWMEGISTNQLRYASSGRCIMTQTIKLD